MSALACAASSVGRDISCRLLSRSNCDEGIRLFALTARRIEIASQDLSADLTDWRSMYIKRLAMSDSGLHAYAPLLLHLLIATGFPHADYGFRSRGVRRPSRPSSQPYEWG